MSTLMKEIKRLGLRGLLVTPTDNGSLQFLRYVGVGGVATIADWGVLFLLTECAEVYYLVSAIFSFITGLIVNYTLSKIFVFNNKAVKVRVKPVIEFLSYGTIGVVGLGLTELILYLLTDIIGVYYMLSKVIATIVVFLWNYLARKKLLYS